MEILTPNLLLLPMDLAHLEAYSRSREEFAETLAVRVPDDWPWEESAAILPWVRQQLAEDHRRLGWLAWFIVHRGDGVLIGDAGFAGLPDDTGRIEMGYNIIEGYRNRGLATEAATALVEWAFSHAAVRLVEAQTLPDGTASMRVLEKIGFARVDEQDQTVRWRLPRPR